MRGTRNIEKFKADPLKSMYMYALLVFKYIKHKKINKTVTNQENTVLEI